MRATNPVGPGLQQGPGLNGVPSRQGIDANWNRRYWVGSAYLRNGVGVRIPGAGSNVVSSPNHASFLITGDIDLRIKTKLRDWAAPAPVTSGTIVPLVQRYGQGVRVGWRFVLGLDGSLQFGCWVTGPSYTQATVAAPNFGDNEDHWLRVTRASATGVVKFYTCPTEDGATWVQWGSDQATTAGVMLAATVTALTIGHDENNNWWGCPQIISNASLWNGIEGSGGVNVFNADFAAQATGTTSFVEANGRTVTITSASMSWGSLGAWSEESGGVGGASLPTAASEVWVDAASGPVAINSVFGAVCGSFDTSEAVGSGINWNASTTLDVGGRVVPDPRFIIGSGFTWSWGGGGSTAIRFWQTGANIGRISVRAGTTLSPVEFRAGSWRLDSDIVPGYAGALFDVYGGNNASLDTNGYTVGSKLLPWQIRLWITVGVRRVWLRSSTVWCSSWTAASNPGTDLSIDAGTSTINVVATGGVFNGGANQRYNVVAFPSLSSSLASIGGLSAGATGTVEIAHLIVRSVAPSTYAGTTANPTTQWTTGANAGSWRITDLTIEGQPNYPLTAFGAGWGLTGAALQVTNAPTLSNVTFVDFPAGGASVPWSGTRLGDGGNNTNITFPVSQTNYWVESTPGLTGSGLYCGTTNGSSGAGGSSRATYAWAPDSVPLSVTGDIDLRAKFSGRITRETSGRQDLITKENGAGSRSYRLSITYTGIPRFVASVDGTNEIQYPATEALWPLSNYTAGWLRATRVAATGTVTFYWSLDGSAWTQLGTPVTGTAGNIFDSASRVWMGVGDAGATTESLDGTLLRAQVYNGIAGTLAFDADFETAPAAALSFTESSVNAATVTVVPFAATSNGAHSDAAHWAISSGGASGTGRVPLAHDDVVYDSNSGTGRPQWDTNDVGRNVTGTGATVGIIDLFPRYIAGGATTQTRIFGSLTVGTLTGVTWTTGASSLEFCGRGATFTHSIGSAFGWGDASTGIASHMRFYPLPSTTHALGSDLNTTWGIVTPAALSTGGGTFDADIYNVTCWSYGDGLTSQTRTVDFGSGTWTLTGVSGTVLSIPNQANLTLAGNPTWVISESLDAVVKNGVWRVPQYGSDPSNTTRATSYISSGQNGWQTPRPATPLTGDLDIIVRFCPDFTRTSNSLISAVGAVPASQNSWALGLSTSATNSVMLAMSTNGSSWTNLSGTSAIPYGDGVTWWMRIVRDRAAGTVKGYYCADQPTVPTAGQWILWSSASGVTTSTLFAGNSDLNVGYGGTTYAGDTRGLSIYHAQVSNVIDGAPVATLDFTALPDYSLSTTDAQGNVWRSYQYASRTTRRVVGGAAVGYATVTGNVWGMPDSAALSITSAIDIQVRARGDAWTTGSGVLVAKYAGAGGRSYNFQQGGANGLLLTLSQDGSNQLQVTSGGSLGLVGIQNGQTIWLRATWRASDGRVQFFFAPDSATPPGSWTQIGTDKNIAYASLYDGTAPLEIGVSNIGLTSPFVSGDFKRVRIFNGIEGSGGTLAFDADFSTLQDDTYAFRESSVNNAVVYASSNGTSGFPAGRLLKNFTVTNKTLPGSSLTVQAGGGGIFQPAGSGNNDHVFPALISEGGKWIAAGDFSYGTQQFPSITWTTSPTGPRNALPRGPGVTQSRWRSSGLVTVNYADVAYNDADGASIPFSNVNGLLYGTTDWIDENIYPDYIILGMQD